MSSSKTVEAGGETSQGSEAGRLDASGKGPVDQTLGGSPAIDPGRVLKKRDPWLDNVRILAAVLIVVMHFAEDLRVNSSAVDGLYYSLWPMRVPLYVLVAGYFSSAEALTGKRAISLLRNILFVYLAFQVIASIQRFLMYEIWYLDLVTPSFALWFLLALFWWRLTLPLLSQIKYLPLIAVVIAVASGFITALGPEFTAARAFGFWPMFILGWKLRQFGLRRALDHRWVRALSTLVLLGSFYAAVVLQPILETRYFTMRRGYTGDLSQQIVEAGIRTLLILFAAVGALSLLALIPKVRIPMLSYLGTGSLYIYLLHPLVMKQIEPYGFVAWVDSRPKIILYVLGTVLLALALGSKPVRFMTRWLIQPRYTWIFRKTPETTGLHK